MVAWDKLTAEQNIAHYCQRLQMGAEPTTRAVMLHLLLNEENTLGLTREQLARIDKHIEMLRGIIAQEQKFIDTLKRVRFDAERSTLILATLHDLMATYQLHRQKIVAAVADGSEA